jgi:effector-binding domain-containing protein
MLPATRTAGEGIALSVPQVEKRKAQPYVAVAVTGPMAKLPQFAPPKIGELAAKLAAAGVVPAGPAFFRYRKFSGDRVELEIAFPVAAKAPEIAGAIKASLPAGRYACATFAGPYDRLFDAMCMLNGWIEGRGLAPAGRPGQPECQVERYRVSPMDTQAAAEWRTDLLVRLAD